MAESGCRAVYMHMLGSAFLFFYAFLKDGMHLFDTFNLD